MKILKKKSSLAGTAKMNRPSVCGRNFSENIIADSTGAVITEKTRQQSFSHNVAANLIINFRKKEEGNIQNSKVKMLFFCQLR